MSCAKLTQLLDENSAITSDIAKLEAQKSALEGWISHAIDNARSVDGDFASALTTKRVELDVVRRKIDQLKSRRQTNETALREERNVEHAALLGLLIENAEQLQAHAAKVLRHFCKSDEEALRISRSCGRVSELYARYNVRVSAGNGGGPILDDCREVITEFQDASRRCAEIAELGTPKQRGKGPIAE